MLDVINTLRQELNQYLSNFTVTHEIDGIAVKLGSCLYSSGEATFKLELIVEGAETREQKALTMYAKFDGLDLDKKHPYYTLVEYHPKKRQYPYIYTDSRKPNSRFKNTTDWAVRHFGKVS